MDKSKYLMDYWRDKNNYLENFSRGGLSTMPPLIISVAITGGNQGKEANPNLPETLEEQVQQTYDAYNAGASVVHIHRRSAANNAAMSSDPDEYREVNARIREKCPDLIINNTAGGGKFRTPDGKVSPPFHTSIYAEPEISTIDISSFIAYSLMKKRPAPLTGRDEDVLVEYSYGIMISELIECYNMMKERGIKPEFECFDIGDFQYIKTMQKMGLLTEEDGPNWVSIVLGEATNFPTLEYLCNAIDHLPRNTMMNLIGIGPVQIPIVTAGIIAGTHIRVGMEDNIYISRGQKAESNAQFVEKVVRIANELGRPIATPAQAREMLGLGEPKPFTY